MKIWYSQSSRGWLLPLGAGVAVCAVGLLVVKVFSVPLVDPAHEATISQTSDSKDHASTRVKESPGLPMVSVDGAVVVDSNLGIALVGSNAPGKPVWEIVQDVKLKKSPTDQDLINAVAALSYCVAGEQALDIARALRSSGQSSSEIDASLETAKNNRMSVCQRLGASDYLLRRQALEQLAARGHLDAMIGLLDVGPLGKWPPTGDYSGVDSAASKEWERNTLLWMEKAVAAGDRRGLITLAEIYSPNVKAIEDGIRDSREQAPFSGIKSTLSSYMYLQAYILAEQNRNQDIGKLLEDKAANLRRDLTQEQIAVAISRATELVSQCCLN